MANDILIHVRADDAATPIFAKIKTGAGGMGETIAGSVKKALLPMGAALGAAALGTLKFADAAGDLGEAMNKANVLFGESAEEVEKFAGSASRSLGLSKRAAFEYTSAIGNILNASGLAEDAAADMSIEMTKLAADLASFNNIPIDEALEKIRSGLVGEAEPLRSVGVLINAAAVETKAYEMGLAAAGEELTEAQKVQARYALILEQTTKAQGDFSRTSGSLANQQRIMSANWENLQAQLGEKLIPVVLKVMEIFNKMPADMQVAGVALAGVTIVLAPLISALVALVPAITAVGAALMTLTLNPVGATIVGLTLLAAAIAVVIIKWDEISAKIREVMASLREHKLEMTLAGAALIALLGPLGLVVGSTAILVANWEAATSVVRTLIQWVKKLADAIKSIPTPGDIFGGVGGAIGGIPGFQHGAIVRHRPGGVIARIGEGLFDEAVVPLAGTRAAVGAGLTLNVSVYAQGSILSERDVTRIVRDAVIRGAFRGMELGT